MRPQRMVSPGEVDLRRWGVLRVADRQHVEVVSDDKKRTVEVPYELLSDGGALVGWVYEDLRRVVLGTSMARVLVELDLDLDEAQELVALERDSQPDLRHLSFREAGPLHSVALWERGLLCLDDRGAVTWKVQHDDLSARFAGVRGGVVWLLTQWPPDVAGRRYGYRLQDGTLVDE